MKHSTYFLLSACLIMGTMQADQFEPTITIKNNSSKHLSLYIFDFINGKPIAAKSNPYGLPKDHERTFHQKRVNMFYLSEDSTLSYDDIKAKGWCLVDSRSNSAEKCWSNRTDGKEIYRISPCSSPLITQAHMHQAEREHNDIVASISTGESQPLVGSVELVPRRGYLGSIWHSTKSFVGSFFGRP